MSGATMNVDINEPWRNDAVGQIEKASVLWKGRGSAWRNGNDEPILDYDDWVFNRFNWAKRKPGCDGCLHGR
jgi:hypothetical protein